MAHRCIACNAGLIEWIGTLLVAIGPHVGSTTRALGCVWHITLWEQVPAETSLDFCDEVEGKRVSRLSGKLNCCLE